MQETFIRAWRAYDRFEGRSALRSWLYRIATNVCYDMLESRKRRARPDGSRAVRRADRREPPHARPALDRADARRARRARRRRSGRDRRRAGVRSSRVRRGAPAAAGAPAGRAHPLRGPALEGSRGRGAPRDECRLGEQRTAACPRNARGERRHAVDDVTVRRRCERRAAAAVRDRVRAVRHGRPHVADPRGRDAVDAAVRPLAHGPRRHLHVVGRPRHMRAAALASSPSRPRTALPRSASTSRARTARATSRGRCRCSRSRTAASSSSRSSSTSRRCSLGSGCRSSTRLASPSWFVEEVFDDLGVAGHPLAEDEELEPVRTRFEAPRHLRADADRVQPLDLDLVVVQMKRRRHRRGRRTPPRPVDAGGRRRDACLA